MTNAQNAIEKQALRDERRQVLEQLEDWLETPKLVLGLHCLALLVVELATARDPQVRGEHGWRRWNPRPRVIGYG